MANQRAEEMRKRGIDVLSLTVGEPDFPTPQHVKDACVRALAENKTKYTASAGILELREAIAEKSRRENGIPADAARTLVSPTKHALFVSFMATLEAGDEVLLPDPGFVSYAPQVRFFGGVPVYVPLREENDFSIDAEDLAAAVTRKTKLILLCSPSNPTGMVDEPEQVKAVVDLAVDRDLLIVSDEIYEKVLYEGRHVSPASLPGGAERTITINGLSKSFAMTGWRSGWLHAPDPVFSAIARIQTQTITQVPTMVQWASLAALQGPQDSVKAGVAEFRARRDLVVAEAKNTPGWTLRTPKGAFYAWPGLDVGVDGDTYAKFLLEEARVAVVAGSAFGPSGTNRIRISYATSRERLKEAFERIRAAMPKLQSLAK